MRCGKVRRLLGRHPAAVSGRPLPEGVVRHMESCMECARFQDQMEEAWQALGSLPVIDVSPDFWERLRKRLCEPAALRSNAIWFHLIPRWKWMALATCLLLLASVVFVRHPDGVPTAIVESGNDIQDEKFLIDLERSLTESEHDYLPAYDAWSEEDPASDPGDIRPGLKRPGNGGVKHEGV